MVSLVTGRSKGIKMQILEALSIGWQRLTPSALCALLITIVWASYLSINMIYSNCTRRRHHRYKLPPGPWPLLVLGNLLQLSGDLPHLRLARLAERYEPLMGLRLGSTPTVVASSARVAREFLQTHDKVFASRPPSMFADRLLYGQSHSLVLAQYGPHWHHVRKVATLQLFSARRVQKTKPLMGEEVARLVHSLAADPAAIVADVDLTRAMYNMVQDLMFRIVFGRRAPDEASAGCSLREMVHRAGALFQVPVLGDFIPWLGFLDRGVRRTIDELHAGFDTLWETLITEREKQHQLNILHGKKNLPNDILDELLLNPSFSRVGIKAQIMDLIGAGIDTTAVTLDWTMAELFNHPLILKKLQVELENLVGLERMVQDSDMTKLPYVAAIVKETLRLHAPVSLLLPHMSREPCAVMGYNLPKGTRLLVNAWVIGRDPATWEDPERFWPERFLKQAGHQELRSQHVDEFSWIPFGSGRRSCPGVPLALPTLELTIANLVHCFDWQLPQGESHVDMSAQTSIVTCRKHSLLATPTLRISLMHSI